MFFPKNGHIPYLPVITFLGNIQSRSLASQTKDDTTLLCSQIIIWTGLNLPAQHPGPRVNGLHASWLPDTLCFKDRILARLIL